jgi:hypothetical protein
MARTRPNPSQPNDASQELPRGENPTEHREARDTREVGEVQMNGAEDVLMERARVRGDLIQGSGLVNDANGGLGARVLQMRPARPQLLWRMLSQSPMGQCKMFFLPRWKLRIEEKG